MKAKALNLKNMTEDFVNFTGSNEEMKTLWKAFCLLERAGYISLETWIKFFNRCAGWHVSKDGTRVLDSRNDNSLVWEYTPDDTFRA